ncbi:MAG: GNAT family N-acetyltransferase [Acidobacteriota bacterium]|nr:GNAT family N-acetyltransferase [Acidobacteriota bacterium]
MDPGTLILETPRLQLRHAMLSDSPFIRRLLNEPTWLEYIGDRGVRTAADAETYIRTRISAQYHDLGYGLYVVQLKSSGAPIGLCGLVKREFLPAPDLGFALLPEHVGQGYAFEAASAVLSHATHVLGIARLYAIVKRGNDRSIRLLDRLGFHQEGPCPGEDPNVDLYITDKGTA